jgi:hypothetical protein
MKFVRSDQEHVWQQLTRPEHACAAISIYPYKPSIVSDEDFEPSEIARKDKIHDENLEETEEGH